MPPRLVFGETSLPGLQVTTISLSPHMALPLCTGTPGVFSYKETIPIELGPPLWSHLTLITPLKPLSSDSHNGA